MCGIGGCVVGPGGRVDRERLERMQRALLHRGPDDRGILIEGGVGLVHTRLAIVDPSARAAQPMRAGDWMLTYNGEVFNHRELRRGLGGRFSGSGDTETVLQALAQRGPAEVGRFAGMFAFAAHDSASRKVYLARDPFGVKPMLWARDRDGSIWFASEVGALLGAGIEARVDPGRIAAAIDGAGSTWQGSLLDGIDEVEPGELVVIDAETLGVERRAYLRPEDMVDVERQAELAGRSRSELTDLLDERLSAAVEASLLADVPVATMCSGGLDSSLITAIAVRHRPGMVAFAASAPEEGSIAEGRAAERAARALGVELELAEVSAGSWRRGLVQAVRHYGRPLYAPGPVAIAQIAVLARRRGLKVLLTGEGADELLGGYRPPHAAAFDAFQPRWMAALQRAHRVRSPQPRRLLAAAARRARPGGRRRPITLVDGRDLPRFALELPPAAAYRHHAGPRGQLEDRLLAALPLSLARLLTRMDRSCMQHSVEARVPFLERPVAELALNLPLEARTGPLLKGILRDVAARHLPRRVALWPKVAGMHFDARSWVAERADPSFLAEGILRETLAVDRERWRAVCEEPGHSRATRLWSAEIWCRQVLAGQPDERIEDELWPRGPG